MKTQTNYLVRDADLADKEVVNMALKYAEGLVELSAVKYAKEEAKRLRELADMSLAAAAEVASKNQ